MRHLEIRDLWLQKEVADGKLLVEKVPGDENPADLMTKILASRDIESRLKSMNLHRESKSCRDNVMDGEDND
eukprot:12011396-Karenia_brevis.AAC.1